MFKPIDFNGGRRRIIRPVHHSMPFTMFDSVNVDQLPRLAEAYAGYVGGNWPTYRELERLYPHRHVLSIAVQANEDARCLDVETGDATIDQVIPWIERQRKRGVKFPVIYVELSRAETMRHILRAESAPFKLWTAHYTGKPHRCNPSCGFGFTGLADATQYTAHAKGRNLDASLCAWDFFPVKGQ